MRVLVLGATGYIGSAIARRLSSGGATVVAVSRRPIRVSEDVHEVRFGDLEDVRTMAHVVTDDIDAVIHAATPTGDWERDRAAVEDFLARHDARLAARVKRETRTKLRTGKKNARAAPV